MNSFGLQIFRLTLAAVNGLLFAFGVWWTVEISVLRIRRWRIHLSRLIRMQELEEGTAEEQAQREREIVELRRRITHYRNDPRNALRLGFSILIICVAMAALVGLIAPPWMAVVH
ncbi:MAG: hypothetical protein V2A56_11220 [bacterium]